MYMNCCNSELCQMFTPSLKGVEINRVTGMDLKTGKGD